MPRISKTFSPKDTELDVQLNEIISNQFANNRQVTLTFPDSSTEVKTDVGFLVDRFLTVDRSADISVYRVRSDNKFTYFKASGAGTVTVMVWKGGN